ncbi:MAG: DinB family protein, partial [Candidatus Eisenbacteria bacterium]
MSDRVHDWPRRLEIDPSAFLAPGAVVTGEVKLGARSSVWFNTVVRGDTDAIVIGADTNLQDLTLVHVDHGQPTVVGNRVTVGHRAILHGCVIEDECLIGMGAILLSGSTVGSGSLIAAGALLREGQSIPSGSLAVGAPARVIGPVGEPHREAIRNGAQHYAALSREYLACGFGQHLPPLNDVRGALGIPPPAMQHSEWGRILAALAESPDWAAELLGGHGAEAFARRPGPGRWSAAEVTAHLTDADREVFAPRLERLLTEHRPLLADVDLVGGLRGTDPPAAPPGELLELWQRARGAALARLVTCGRAEWSRRGTHSARGPYSIADLA